VTPEAGSRLRPPAARLREATSRISRVRLAAVLVLAAELGHLLAILNEWPLWEVRGAFHTVAAVAQGLLAASLLVGPGHKALRRGAILNLLLAVLWLFSRTMGIPSIVTLQRLPIGVLDALTAAVEVAAAIVIATEWRARRRATSSGADTESATLG